jgi:hypothetical protein
MSYESMYDHVNELRNSLIDLCRLMPLELIEPIGENSTSFKVKLRSGFRLSVTCNTTHTNSICNETLLMDPAGKYVYDGQFGYDDIMVHNTPKDVYNEIVRLNNDLLQVEQKAQAAAQAAEQAAVQAAEQAAAQAAEQAAEQAKVQAAAQAAEQAKAQAKVQAAAQAAKQAAEQAAAQAAVQAAVQAAEKTPKTEMKTYFIYNDGDEEEITGFKYDVKTRRWECVSDHSIFVSGIYSYWDRFCGDMPFNPWDQTRDDDEYNNEHTNEMVCFVYRIENSEFTTADVFASKEFDDEDSGGGTSFNVNVNVLINGEPANYTLTASLDSSAYGDCETVINLDHFKFNGFPPGISLNIKKVASRGYYDEDNTWALSATP